MSDGPGMLVLTVGASCLLHAAGVLMMTRRPMERPAPRPIAAISFEILTTKPEPQPAPVEPMRLRLQRPAVARPRAPAVAVTVAPQPVEQSEPAAQAAEPVLAPVVAKFAASPGGHVDVSPLAAARTLIDTTAPASPGEYAIAVPVESPSERFAEAQLAEKVEGLWRVGEPQVGQVLQRGLQTALRPWELVIKPLHGGRYRYEGKGFAAIIRNDGSVDMRDHSGVHLTLVPVYKGGRNEGASIGVGLSLPNPLEWLMNKVTHTDPYRAERLEFLEHTRDLREMLLARAMKRNLARADRLLDQELKRIWSKQGAEFAAEQHRLTLTLWEQCSDDEIGRVMRARIESFVGERCPQGSDCELDARSPLRHEAARIDR